ncbi:MAG: hypothetical protein J6Y58_06565 [Clostridiales bacterium]|nr:hypothetical protein [Clostridiales bacterium]
MADEEKKITEAVEEEVEAAAEKTEETVAEKAAKVKDAAEAKTEKTAETSGSKKKKSAKRRMIEHRIKIIAIIVAVIAVLVTIFFTCIASYSFSEKAWHVKFDPIHGYSYTIYQKQDFTPAHIVIDSCSKGSSEVTVPDSIWGVRVDEISDNAFKDSVKTVKLGKNIVRVGEGCADKTIVLPYGYGSTGFLTAFKDKNGSGFYYKALADKTLCAYAYFGEQGSYQMPKTFAGIPVSQVVEYYANDGYTEVYADYVFQSSTLLPYNMHQVQLIEKEGIDPYANMMDGATSRDKIRGKLLGLPQNYRYNADGTPADGETAIKLAIVQRGNGVGKTCGDVLKEYSPRDFVTAVKYISDMTAESHTEDEPDFEAWMMEGFVTP